MPHRAARGGVARLLVGVLRRTRRPARAASAPARSTAAFFNFHPAMVARAVPGCWDVVAPETLCRVRAIAAAEALGEVCRTSVTLRPVGLAAAAPTGRGGLRRGGTNHGGRQPVALAPHCHRAGDRWARRGLAGLHDAARAPRRRACGGARRARRQRPGGARAGRRDQGHPRGAAAGQPRLERGGMGRRHGRARAPGPVARRRARDRCRSYPARRGRGADRRAGRARLCRAERPGPRGAARRAGRLRRRRGRLRRGALPQPDGAAASRGCVRPAGAAASRGRAPSSLHSLRDETIWPAKRRASGSSPSQAATSPATSGGAGT